MIRVYIVFGSHRAEVRLPAVPRVGEEVAVDGFPGRWGRLKVHYVRWSLIPEHKLHSVTVYLSPRAAE